MIYEQIILAGSVNCIKLLIKKTWLTARILHCSSHNATEWLQSQLDIEHELIYLCFFICSFDHFMYCFDFVFLL